ncbi:DUF5131 family protein [Roseiconus lacunae]|uniref:DUF5131 family protein n=1 Tax=Roseiconus lacunae TaxID=2605694 RepID=UPI001E2DD825|nr:DUF5131 family protein [Roseiconus lacunae]MCD0462171.1 phage Gp37/Gp68 family protein [Roseiconus lacunae]
MADKTKIEWCDSTVNPIMGCGGCELYPKPGAILTAIDTELKTRIEGWKKGLAREVFRELIDVAWQDLLEKIGEPLSGHTNEMTTTNIWHLRTQFADRVKNQFGGKLSFAALWAVESQITCYAAKLHLNKGRSIVNPTRNVHAGHALTFETVTQFPGRVSDMADEVDLRGADRPDKPWLNGLPRLVFVSDMGDALTRKTDFPFLQRELAATQSENGLKHLWLWLTKRPGLMRLYADRVGGLPRNYCAMTTVTSMKTLHRVDELRDVNAQCRGLSVEPLWSSVADEIDLRGIDWVIVGGESGKLGVVREFHVEWALELKQKCEQQGVAFFVKQLGKCPVLRGEPFRLNAPKVDDWTEWSDDLQTREVPEYFLYYRAAGVPSPSALFSC